MKPELRVSYLSDDDGTGELTATVSSGGFCGSGSAWFNREELQGPFIKSLRKYPIASANAPEIRGGYWDRENSTILDQCHLAIAITPHDVRGDLLVQVELTSVDWISGDKDRQQSVCARFLTDYPAVETFAAELEQVISGTRDFAVLKGMSRP